MLHPTSGNQLERVTVAEWANQMPILIAENVNRYQNKDILMLGDPYIQCLVDRKELDMPEDTHGLVFKK